MIRLVTFLFALSFGFTAFASKPKITLQEYIETWKDVAIDNMNNHGIPASITLAQGILESGFGNSTLATRANNHFGIKCHDWSGKKFYQDDDAKNECFRKYKNAAESFDDHSEFLKSRSRYASLFDLKTTDYKGWAKGLKAAGYATNPKYANLLIDLIQKHKLYEYDEYTLDYIANNSKKPSKKPNAPTISKDKNTHVNSTVNQARAHQVLVNQNRTKYVIAKKHDTFYLIAKEFGINIKQLNKWNNFHPRKDVLSEGDIVYIMPKSKKGATNLAQIKVQQGQDLWSISQEYGIKLKSLLDKNNLESPEVALSAGDIIKLK